MDYLLDIRLKINHRHDLRNYRVRCDRITDQLGFRAKHDVRTIVCDLIQNRAAFSDFDNPNYYQIRVFKMLNGTQTVRIRGKTSFTKICSRKIIDNDKHLKVVKSYLLQLEQDHQLISQVPHE